MGGGDLFLSGCLIHPCGWTFWRCQNNPIISNLGLCAAIFFECHHKGCQNNPIISNLGLCATLWHILCVIRNLGQYHWIILSLFSIILYAMLEKNITRKLLSLSLGFSPKILPFPWCFLYIQCYPYHFSLLHSGLVVIAVCDCLFQFMELVKFWIHCKLM